MTTQKQRQNQTITKEREKRRKKEDMEKPNQPNSIQNKSQMIYCD